MFHFLRSLAERLHARRADSCLDFEAELLARAAQRKAVLLRQADRLHDEGLTAIAEELRRRAASINFAKPMCSLLPLAPEASNVHKPATETNGNRLTDLTRKKN